MAGRELVIIQNYQLSQKFNLIVTDKLALKLFINLWLKYVIHWILEKSGSSNIFLGPLD